jgi:hypothetical protein
VSQIDSPFAALDYRELPPPIWRPISTSAGVLAARGSSIHVTELARILARVSDGALGTIGAGNPPTDSANRPRLFAGAAHLRFPSDAYALVILRQERHARRR